MIALETAWPHQAASFRKRPIPRTARRHKLLRFTFADAPEYRLRRKAIIEYLKCRPDSTIAEIVAYTKLEFDLVAHDLGMISRKGLLVKWGKPSKWRLL